MTALRGIATRTTSAQRLGIFRAVVGLLTVAKAVELAWPVQGGSSAIRAAGPLWPLLVAGWAVAGGALLAGFQTRWAAACVSLIAALLLTAGDQYSNHLYLLGVFALLLVVADSGAAMSLDARRRGTPPEVRSWPVTLLKVQLSVVYAFSAIGKINSHFLLGNVVYHRTEASIVMPGVEWLAHPGLFATLSVALVLLELFVAAALWVPRLREHAFVVGVGLHLLMVVVVSDSARDVLRLTIFGLLALSAYALFLDVDPGSRSLSWNPACRWCGRAAGVVRRLDWFQALRYEERADIAPGVLLVAEAPGRAVGGLDAVRRVLSVLPLTFLAAPLLRLLPIRRRPTPSVVASRTR